MTLKYARMVSHLCILCKVQRYLSIKFVLLIVSKAADKSVAIVTVIASTTMVIFKNYIVGA